MSHHWRLRGSSPAQLFTNAQDQNPTGILTEAPGQVQTADPGRISEPIDDALEASFEGRHKGLAEQLPAIQGILNDNSLSNYTTNAWKYTRPRCGAPANSQSPASELDTGAFVAFRLPSSKGRI